MQTFDRYVAPPQKLIFGEPTHTLRIAVPVSWLAKYVSTVPRGQRSAMVRQAVEYYFEKEGNPWEGYMNTRSAEESLSSSAKKR